jgi:LysM repeat protein
MSRTSSSRLAVFVSAVLAVLLLSSASTSAETQHVVKEGDTLGGIALRYGIGVEALQAWNRIFDPNTIIEGSTVRIPDSATNAAPQGQVTTVYVVQPGDTLGSVASRFGVDVAALASRNGISNVNLIRDGRSLTIPNGGSGGGTASAAPAPTAATSYTVQVGDTLSSIAARFGTSVSAIASANGISNLDLVRIGSTLSVTAGSSNGASTAPAATGGGVSSLVDQWAAHYGVPADLLKALTWFESGWNNRLISSTGAIGIGQLMPATVDFVSDVLIGLPLDPHNSNDNVRMSARFLSYLLNATGDPRLALGAYYQGLGSLQRRGIYQSSIFYVDGILALRSRF